MIETAPGMRPVAIFEELGRRDPGLKPSEELSNRVEESVAREIGAIARPRRVTIVGDMPKTRSGKIMRHVLAAISNNEDPATSRRLRIPESSKRFDR